MIDTKTLTCSNCRGGDFIRLDDNEFKCTHCNSITIVQDDVAERLEQLLRRLQAPAPAAAAPLADPTAAKRVGLVVAGVVAMGFAFFIATIAVNRSTGSAPFSGQRQLPDVDPGLVKIQDLHPAPDGGKMIGMVRNDSDRVISNVTLTLRVKQGEVRKDDQSASMSERLLPGESRPIAFTWWAPGGGETFDIAKKEVRTEDDFVGRASLRVEHPQLIRKGESLRFIGRLVNAGAFPARSISVSVTLLDRNGRLIGDGRSSPESAELARGEMTRFDVSIGRHAAAEIASMQYVIDSERMTAGDRP